MSDIPEAKVGSFNITDRGIERTIKLLDYGAYAVEVVLPKETFIEAYKKWIEPETRKDKE